jgi:hypothetical protein
MRGNGWLYVRAEAAEQTDLVRFPVRLAVSVEKVALYVILGAQGVTAFREFERLQRKTASGGPSLCEISQNAS